jgi:type I restriction enzyme S subunit
MLRLGEIAKVTAGQAAPKNFGNDGYPFIRAGHLEELIGGKSLSDLPKVSQEVSKQHRLNLLPKHSIIFAKSGMSATKNRIYILKEEAYFVSHLAAILPNENIDMNYLSKYLFWYNPTNLILDEAYPSIRLEDINNLKIPLPPLPQQKKIANILDAADSLRQNDKALIAKYDELTQALFLDMFGDPVKNNLDLPFPKIRELTNVSQGMQIAIKERFKENGPNRYKYLTVAYLNGRKEEEYIESPRASVICNKDEILMIRTGNTGQVVTNVEGVFHNNFFKIDWDKKRLSKNYLVYFLSNPGIRRDLLKRASTTTIPDLSHGQFYDLNIIVPPLDLQNQFAERVSVIEEQKAIAQKSLEKSESLFNSLLQKAFKGELV